MTRNRLTFVSLSAICAPLLAMQVSRDLRLDLDDTPATPQARAAGTPTRWGLVVGISTYQYLPPRAQLRYAHRDAEEYARFLSESQGGSLPQSQLRLLTEEKASVASIRSALHQWLRESTGPKDIVYIFLAGHGVVGEGGEAYFVANDSDPQNLHATALPFRELNEAIGNLRAGMVVLVADACHSGSIGWTGPPETMNTAHAAFESLGSKDRLVLKLLASRPSERSYEDARWGGGHGVFTQSLLEGLRGSAEREADGFVRASELIDYVSRVVPEQTGSKQNPRIAGNFEPRLALAILPRNRTAAVGSTALNLKGPAGATVYLDNVFRGAIRNTGDLRLEAVAAGPRRLSVDLPGGYSVEQMLQVGGVQGQGVIDISQLAGGPLLRLRSLVDKGVILESGGAWEYFRSQRFPAEHLPAARFVMAGALENLGQGCVSDYVQSTSMNLKRQMLLRAAAAYEALQALRPNDRAIAAKQKFCLGRAQIAVGQFEDAEQSLRASLAIDKQFACAHNALGVALLKQGRSAEARAAFDRAAELTPEWSLPFYQIGQQLLAADKVKQALPYFEKAAQFNPRSMAARWTLLHTYRLLDRPADVERTGKEAIALDPNYAPTYLELGIHYENRRDYARATLAYDAYLTLAPNFADSAAVRQHANRSRGLAGSKAMRSLTQ